MKNSEIINKVDYVLENGEERTRTYYIQAVKGLEDEEYFGLRIDEHGKDGRISQSEQTPPISASRCVVLEMGEAFAKGALSPMHLFDAVDDWDYIA